MQEGLELMRENAGCSVVGWTVEEDIVKEILDKTRFGRDVLPVEHLGIPLDCKKFSVISC